MNILLNSLISNKEIANGICMWIENQNNEDIHNEDIYYNGRIMHSAL